MSEYTISTEHGCLTIYGPGMAWILPNEYTEVMATSIARNMQDCLDAGREESAKRIEELEVAMRRLISMGKAALPLISYDEQFDEDYQARTKLYIAIKMANEALDRVE